MKNNLIKIGLVVITIIFHSCIDDSKTTVDKEKVVRSGTQKQQSHQNLNISFLLDLSDRIDTIKHPNESMEYYLRDVAYIQSVSEAFYTHLRNKKVRYLNDKIQVFFDPEPQNKNINSISSELKFEVSRNNASVAFFDTIKDVYASKPKEIYELSITDNSYIGSNTWRFFKNKVKDYCIEENFRNILVVLTDGYIYHKDTKIREDNKTTYLTTNVIRNFNLNSENWKAKITDKKFGFIPATKNLDNLEVLVLGINPNPKNPYEEDVVVQFWSEWFDAMNVNKYQIKNAELPSNMDKIIKQFILN